MTRLRNNLTQMFFSAACPSKANVTKGLKKRYSCLQSTCGLVPMLAFKSEKIIKIDCFQSFPANFQFINSLKS